MKIDIGTEWVEAEQAYQLVPTDPWIRDFLRRAYGEPGKRKRLYFKDKAEAEKARDVLNTLVEMNLQWAEDGSLHPND